MHSMFSFSRWWMLVSLHWAENRRRYGLGVLAMGGLLLFWFSVVLAMDAYTPLSFSYQFATFYIGLFFTGCLFGSQVFSALNRKREAIQYPMGTGVAPGKAFVRIVVWRRPFLYRIYGAVLPDRYTDGGAGGE